MANNGPLTDEHLQQINDNLALLKELDGQIKQAKAADIDVSVLEQQARDLRTKINKIKQAYFPGAR